jgi:hypothetical protein
MYSKNKNNVVHQHSLYDHRPAGFDGRRGMRDPNATVLAGLVGCIGADGSRDFFSALLAILLDKSQTTFAAGLPDGFGRDLMTTDF